MHRLAISCAFGALLATSLAVKTLAALDVATYRSDDDIIALMTRHQLKIERAAPNADPGWIYGSRDRCRIKIANVSVQGWHRDVVEWQAVGKTLIFSANGGLYDRQPILKPLVTFYARRLERQLGIAKPPVAVRAIIIPPECPSDLIDPAELSALS